MSKPDSELIVEDIKMTKSIASATIEDIAEYTNKLYDVLRRLTKEKEYNHLTENDKTYIRDLLNELHQKLFKTENEEEKTKIRELMPKLQDAVNKHVDDIFPEEAKQRSANQQNKSLTGGKSRKRQSIQKSKKSSKRQSKSKK